MVASKKERGREVVSRGQTAFFFCEGDGKKGSGERSVEQKRYWKFTRPLFPAPRTKEKRSGHARLEEKVITCVILVN